MTYEVYIKKDYKPVNPHTKLESASSYRLQRLWFSALFLVAAICLIVWTQTRTSVAPLNTTETNTTVNKQTVATPTPPTKTTRTQTHKDKATTVTTSQQTQNNKQDTVSAATFHAQHDEHLRRITTAPATVQKSEPPAIIPSEPEWQTIKIKRGESLSLIFDRMQLSPRELHEIMLLGKATEILKHIKPDQEIRFKLKDKQLAQLEYDVDLTNRLLISRTGNTFKAETLTTELETRVSESSGIINHSLFLAAQRAGLSDNLTMQLVSLYGWDIDFVLDIRKNDYFHVIYEEQYKDGVKVGDGPILAAEFVNRDKPIRTVRYQHEDGRINYYSEDGFSMRKAFLRTPVDFRRISSGFNLSRRHPVLNTIRAHKGVDYAASSGTPIKAAGDGVVEFAGRKGGYGRVVTLRHGNKYSTLYAHMSKFARGISVGKRVKQGQTIGYVGMSGLATGPHLHYEFRIDGVHRNPLTVKLPKALRVQDDELPHFKTQTRNLLAQLDALTSKSNIAKKLGQDPSLIAMNRDNKTATSSKN